MSSHIRIDKLVHFDMRPDDNSTLCGLFASFVGKPIKTQVNCPECARILNFCFGVQGIELKKELRGWESGD